MAAMIKEETRMDTQVKTYLQMYEEFVDGYKQYKKEKTAQAVKAGKGRLMTFK